jgi:hypothetical protein
MTSKTPFFRVLTAQAAPVLASRPMSEHDDDAIEIVASVGALDATVVALREFVHRSGALRAVGLVEREPGEGPAVVECGRLAAIEVDLGDRVVHMPHGIELDVAIPLLPGVRQLPPFDVDAATGEVAGTIGGLDHLVAGVCGLADALGGRNVAMAVFETTDEETPLAITARAGGAEPVVIAIGEDQFELAPRDQAFDDSPPDAAA